MEARIRCGSDPAGNKALRLFFHRRSQTTLLEVGRSSSQSAFRIASLAVVEWARRGGRWSPTAKLSYEPPFPSRRVDSAPWPEPAARTLGTLSDY